MLDVGFHSDSVRCQSKYKEAAYLKPMKENTATVQQKKSCPYFGMVTFGMSEVLDATHWSSGLSHDHWGWVMVFIQACVRFSSEILLQVSQQLEQLTAGNGGPVLPSNLEHTFLRPFPTSMPPCTQVSGPAYASFCCLCFESEESHGEQYATR